MSVQMVPVNAVGEEVVSGSKYHRMEKAIAWQCDGCGCTGGAMDVVVWGCACSCHDGWKFAQDGGRYRDQLGASAAGIDLRHRDSVDCCGVDPSLEH